MYNYYCCRVSALCSIIHISLLFSVLMGEPASAYEITLKMELTLPREPIFSSFVVGGREHNRPWRFILLIL